MTVIQRTYELVMVHEYQAKTGPGEKDWGKIETRHNNSRACAQPGTFQFEADLKSFMSTFGNRISETPTEYGPWKRKFEGIWGYRWRDVDVILRTKIVKVTERSMIP